MMHERCQLSPWMEGLVSCCFVWGGGGGDLFKVQGWLHQGRTCRDAVSSPQRICRSKKTSIFSQNPTLLQFVITGCVDIKFELVKFGEYINRDSIKVQS
jgi:hypothetical protein